MKHYPPSSFFIEQSEVFFERPQDTYRKLLIFMGLDYVETVAFKVYNAGKHNSIPVDVRNDVRKHFEPYNQELVQFLDREFGFKLDLAYWGL